MRGYSDIPTLGAEPPKLQSLREAARKTFAAEGLPGPRVEAWKYTSLQKLADFVPAEPHALSGSLPDGIGCRIVLVDGVLDGARSDLHQVPDGVEVIALPDGFSKPAILGALGGLVPERLAPMAALNTARFQGGVAIVIAARTRLSAPLYLMHLTGAGAASDPRVLVLAGEGSEVTLVETSRSVGEGAAVTNRVAEITLGDRARLSHYALTAPGEGVTDIGYSAVSIGAGASYAAVSLSCGAGLARAESRVTLAGPRAEAQLSGAYVGRGEAHIDTTTFVDHAAPDCLSRQLFKGVLDDRSRGVFQGKVLVRPEGQRTDGHQLHKALLVSPKAEADCKPELEIYADDVKCSHGATVGDLDLDQLFYLRARGIDAATARRLLIGAFAAEPLEAIGPESVRAMFLAELAEALGGAAE